MANRSGIRGRDDASVSGSGRGSGPVAAEADVVRLAEMALVGMGWPSPVLRPIAVAYNVSRSRIARLHTENPAVA